MTTTERLRTNKVEFLLTVLVITLKNRASELKELLDLLYHQADQKPVQILWLGDNKSLITGDKRNAIMSLANGRYLTFVDDDDLITENYIEKILEAIDHNPEVITFLVDKHRNGTHEKFQRFDIDYQQNYTTVDRAAKRRYQNMVPNHLCVWRKDIIKEAFPPHKKTEDLKWADKQTQHYTKEGQYHINEVLYYYMFDNRTTETQNRH